LWIGLLVSCGGGGYGGGSSRPQATVSISVEPTTITLGQTATVTWNSNGTTCTASGAWNGVKGGSGSEVVTPTATGMFTYSLLCSGGGYTESQTLSATLTVNAMSGFVPTSLVSQFAGTAAPTTDSRLTNPRGIAFAPNVPVRVVNSTTATAYDGNGKSASSGMMENMIGRAFDSTAIVANASPDFIVKANGKLGPAEFIYAGKAGMISGTSSAVDRVTAVPMYTATDGAVYTGLTIASNGKGTFLYATDFHGKKIDVMDASLTRQARSTESFAFSDPALPAGYAPFGIQAVENRAAGSTQIYVSYAQQLAPDNRDNAVGAGLGLVNVFDTNGKLLRQLVPAGVALNAPWGMALAPADFGTFSNALLIGNSGDGKINAFDPVKGTFIGTLSDSDARPIVTRGLRGIAFGNDSNDQPHNALFFTAGTDAADGSFGRIDLISSQR